MDHSEKHFPTNVLPIELFKCSYDILQLLRNLLLENVFLLSSFIIKLLESFIDTGRQFKDVEFNRFRFVSVLILKAADLLAVFPPF